MPRYFYLIHPFLASVVSLEVPLYLAAPDISQAKADAQLLIAAFKTQFDILFEPSDPLLVVPSVNESRFDALIARLKSEPKVDINLPQQFSVSCYQHPPFSSALITVEARVLVPGTHSSVYSL